MRVGSSVTGMKWYAEKRIRRLPSRRLCHKKFIQRHRERFSFSSSQIRRWHQQTKIIVFTLHCKTRYGSGKVGSNVDALRAQRPKLTGKQIYTSQHRWGSRNLIWTSPCWWSNLASQRAACSLFRSRYFKNKKLSNTIHALLELRNQNSSIGVVWGSYRYHAHWRRDYSEYSSLHTSALTSIAGRS